VLTLPADVLGAADGRHADDASEAILELEVGHEQLAIEGERDALGKTEEVVQRVGRDHRLLARRGIDRHHARRDAELVGYQDPAARIDRHSKGLPEEAALRENGLLTAAAFDVDQRARVRITAGSPASPTFSTT
jgi:hypothetical protein